MGRLVKSHAYRGRVFHKRFAPAEHDFHYEMDYLFLHVDEIEALCKLSKFWSADAVNLISINRRDYLPGDRPLKEQVELEVARLGGQSGFSDVYLLTTPRRLGHCMNPISLFFCYQGQELRHVLAEVHNTPWNERHTYLVDGPDFSKPTTKAFHVSPFMPMDTTYHWSIGDPGDELHVTINVTREGAPLFTANMCLVKQEITEHSIASITRRQIHQSFRTLSAIYFQAANQWRKKIPFFRHPNKSKLKESIL
jgi:DUF1365 family protein